MDLVKKQLSELIPYDNNPRDNDGAVEAVKQSIQQCEYIAPIIVDENMIILAGHTRLKALKELGWTECDVLIKEGLTDEQKQKYRLLDNKTAELADWDYEKLEQELEDLDFGNLSLDWGINEASAPEPDNFYSDLTDIPQYTPDLLATLTMDDLVNTTKTDVLIEEIEQSDLTDEEKSFLKLAAARHLRFNYKNIANYYATASAEMQDLMEKSALVFIDYNDAIKNGYTRFRTEIKECL